MRGPRARWLCIGGVLVASCSWPERSEPTPLGKFGVFFGGQVQERDEIPFELDRARQLQGFRVEIAPPPAEPLEVRWELSLPAASSARSVDAQGRKVPARRSKRGQARMRPGETRLEQPLPFAPDDPLGLWNIRVLAGEHVVIDRPFMVYDARLRARVLERRAASADAGI